MMLRQRSSASTTSSLPTRFDSSSSSLPLASASRRVGSYHLYSSSSHLDGSATSVSRKTLCLAVTFLLLPWGLYNRTQAEWIALNEKMRFLQNKHSKLGHQLNSKKDLLAAFESTKSRTEASNDAIVADLRLRGVLVDTHAENYEKLEAREDALLRNIDELERRIQDNGRLALKEEYGLSPYQVELTLSSMNHEHMPTRDPIVFELAPLSAMPHSVHHFLRMVTAGVWVDKAFTPRRSVHHRIHASPVEIETFQRVDWEFTEQKLTRLAFNEQSADYACGPYSVGFSDPIGHPDFFVNGAFVPKRHARGGSCFAKVISGEKVIDNIIDNHHTVFGIESMRLLPKSEMIFP